MAGKAIDKHAINSSKQYLLIACEISPKLRKFNDLNPTWVFWDKTDICHQIRYLSLDNQLRLVDKYFPGFRESFLGIAYPSSWQTTEEFFSRYIDNNKIINHTWPLVGRLDFLNDLYTLLFQQAAQVVILTGIGASGKSKLLYELSILLEKDGSKNEIRFLSKGGRVSSKEFEQLSKDLKLLIVDDAHELELDQLKQVINNHAHYLPNSKLLLTSRPYAEYIQNEVCRNNLSYIRKDLEPFNILDAEKLSEHVLQHFDADIKNAKQIAKYTCDSPFFV